MANTTITVQDSTGVALSGATISYLVNAVAADATTDTAGQVIIAGLEAGTYKFTAVLSGYSDSSADVTVVADTDATGTITMTATLVSTIVSAVAPIVVTTVAEELAAWKEKLNAKIAASHSWAKLGYIVLLALLNTFGTKMLSYVKSKLS